MVRQFFRIATQSIEVLRFQIIFTTMLAGMAVGVFLFGHNQHITYVAMGSFVAIPSLIAALFFMWLYYAAGDKEAKSDFERLLDLASRILILFGLAAAFFLILGTFDRIIPQQPSSVLGISFVISMLLSYFLYTFSIAAARPTPQQLVHYVALGLISCTVIGVAIDGTDDWWTKHFSALGASTANSALLFRIALTMTSLAFVIIGHRITQAVRRQEGGTVYSIKARTKIILIFFYTTAAASTVAAFVGYDQNFVIHDTAAKILGATVALFIASSYWLFPRMPKSFIAYSMALAVASLVSWPYVQSLELKLSYYEIVSTAGAVIWLSMLLHLLEASGQRTDLIYSGKGH